MLTRWQWVDIQEIETLKRASMKTIQLGQVEGVKNTTGLVRKKKNFDKKITARTEARILGTTEWAIMTTRDSVE